MKKTINSLLAISLLASLPSLAAKVTLPAKAGIELKGDYYQSNVDSSHAVLMLHQCNFNRSMYNNIGKQLAKQGIHALSIDFRGFGESINKEFSVESIQKLPAEKRREAWQTMSKHWLEDVQLAYNYLKSKVENNSVIGVIGASCGGSQAITLAENNPIKAIGFFSSQQREENITRYQNTLADKATLIIASEEDGGTYTSAQKLFEKAKHNNSKFVSYKGNGHGYPLLDKDAHLADSIVNWFDSQLTE